jgi:hypothetical protein
MVLPYTIPYSSASDDVEDYIAPYARVAVSLLSV